MKVQIIAKISNIKIRVCNAVKRRKRECIRLRQDPPPP